MSVGRIACALAVVAVLCVLGIFFFPVMNGPGPYSAVHGPVTALLSIRTAVRLRSIIVHTGLVAIRGWFGTIGAALATALVERAGHNRIEAGQSALRIQHDSSLLIYLPQSLSNLFTPRPITETWCVCVSDIVSVL